MVMLSGTIVVIGAGSIGKRHFQNLQILGARAELIAWRDFDGAKLALRHDITGMVIATQTPIRLELITLCAKQGWPFYAEKPLAWTTDQVAEIYDAAAPVATKSMLGFMMRYHPVLRELAAMDLSDVFRFHAEIGHDVRKWRQNWHFADSYAAKAEGGGVLLDLCHEIDLVAALFAPLQVCDARSFGHSAFAGVDFATSLHLTAGNGAAGIVAMDYLSPVFVRKMSLSGENQRIDADFQAASLTVHGLDHLGHTVQKAQSFPFERNDMFLAAMGDFLSLVAGEDLPADPLRPRFDMMRATNELIAAAWQARQFAGFAQLEDRKSVV
jgi:predicted dehydrogenase